MNVPRTALSCLVAICACNAQTALAPYRIDTIAGGTNVGDGGTATLAALSDAEGICIDGAGNVYVADANDHRVRKISLDGTISTVAGTGQSGSDGAQLSFPYGVAVDPAGSLYIADLGNNRIRKVDTSGNITSVLDGNGQLSGPRNVQVDLSGNVFVSEFTGQKILRIAADGTVTVVAGTGAAGFSGDGGPASSAQISYPAGLVLSPDGSLYFADSGNHRVRKVAGGTITSVLGTGDAGADLPTQLNVPTGVALDAAGNLYVADSGNQRVRKLTPSGVVSTIDVAARDVAVDAAGNLWTAGGAHVYQVLPTGVISLAAGDGSYLFRGDGDAATSARFNGPSGIAVDASGAIWIADEGNQRIRKISTDGIIDTVATGLTSPGAIALDASGKLFVADINADQIKTLDPASGLVAPVPLLGALQSPTAIVIAADGTLYIADTANDRIVRTNGTGYLMEVPFGPLKAPRGVAVDTAGNVWVADTGNNVIRKLQPNGVAKTITTSDQLSGPRGIAIDSTGTLWIADTGNHRVRALSPDGTIATVAEQLNQPVTLAVDSAGRILVADFGSNLILRLSLDALPVVSGDAQSISVVNAASLAQGPVAPGEIVSIFGTALGPTAGASGTVALGVLGAKIADTQVLFDGVPAPLFYAGAGQVNAQIPFETAGHATTGVEVFNQGQSRGKATINLADAAPAFFTLASGTGPVVAINEDGGINSGSHPAASGSIVILYATGLGQTAPPGVTGRLAAVPLGQPLLPVKVTVGFYNAEVLFAGDAPGFVGLTQMNVRLPGGFLGSGILPISLSVGTFLSTPGNTIAIQ